MRRKYRNQPITMDGIRFDSKKEAMRWSELLLLERAGDISLLSRQPIYHLSINGVMVCKYAADFEYFFEGNKIVEDVKSPATRKNPTYRIKKKLMKAIHGIDIVEV